MFSVRWVLYPINIGLVVGLIFYVIAFLRNDWVFARGFFSGGQGIWDMENLMVLILGFVDASMVANFIIMIVQGGHQIFIHKFDLEDNNDRPQWLDHIDSGLLKVKGALSIAGITLVQILKDFVHVEKIDWTLTEHRIIIHLVAVLTSLGLALNWRITHPAWMHKDHES
jgi:uncharacterized protein (TIGR00645 family)